MPEVWSFAPHVNLSSSFLDVIEKLLCQSIAVAELGVSHMAVAFPESGYVIEADADGVVRNVARDDVLSFCDDGSRIIANRFTPPLTAAQIAAGDKFLDGIIGDPYDFLDLIRRGIEVIADGLGVVISNPVLTIIRDIAAVDWQTVLGLRGWICFRVVAGYLQAVGFGGINEAEWGPRELAQMQAAGMVGPDIDVATAELPEIES